MTVYQGKQSSLRVGGARVEPKYVESIQQMIMNEGPSTPMAEANRRLMRTVALNVFIYVWAMVLWVLITMGAIYARDWMHVAVCALTVAVITGMFRKWILITVKVYTVRVGLERMG